MKKITLLFVLIGMISLQSCTINEDNNNVDNDTIAEVFEVTRSFTPSNNFSSLVVFSNPIYSSDMVLVYRLSAVDNGADVWRLLPETHYFNDGTLDFRYDYDFTRYDVNLFMQGYELQNLSTNYRINQVFRVVIIPAYLSNKSSVNYEDFNSVMQFIGKGNKDIKRM